MKAVITTVVPEPEINRWYEAKQDHPVVLACTTELGMSKKHFVTNADICINQWNKVAHMKKGREIEAACVHCERMADSYPQLKTKFSIQHKFIVNREVILRQFGVEWNGLKWFEAVLSIWSGPLCLKRFLYRWCDGLLRSIPWSTTEYNIVVLHLWSHIPLFQLDSFWKSQWYVILHITTIVVLQGCGDESLLLEENGLHTAPAESSEVQSFSSQTYEKFNLCEGSTCQSTNSTQLPLIRSSPRLKLQQQ